MTKRQFFPLDYEDFIEPMKEEVLLFVRPLGARCFRLHRIPEPYRQPVVDKLIRQYGRKQGDLYLFPLTPMEMLAAFMPLSDTDILWSVASAEYGETFPSDN